VILSDYTYHQLCLLMAISNGISVYLLHNGAFDVAF